MRALSLALLLALASCDVFVRANPDYCTSNDQCPTGSTCNLTLHRCGRGLTLSAVSPAPVPPAGGPVQIMGSGFQAGAMVQWNGTTLTGVTFVSATELDVVAPASDGACRPVTITVTNPDGSNVTNNHVAAYRHTLMMAAMASAITVPTGGAKAAAAADFNADGVSDLVFLSNDGSMLTVQPLTGSFMPKGAALTATLGGNFTAVTPARLFSAGTPDLIVRSTAGYMLAQVVSGSSLSTQLPMPPPNAGIAAGLLDGDAVPDLVVANTQDKRLDILLSRAGSFTSSGSLPLGNAPSAVVVADFDNDGKQDILAAIATNTGVTFFHGNGDGTFGSPVATATAGLPPTFLATADLDRNGTRDFVVAGGPSSGSGILVGYGDGKGGFNLASVISVNAPLILATGDEGYDLDCDGFPEIIYYGMGDSSVSIYPSPRGQAMIAPTPIPVPDVVESLAVGQFNGDAKPDLILITGTVTKSILAVPNSTP